MAESQSGFDMLAYKYEQDKGMADVMPDHWSGHARIVAYEEADDLDQDAAEFAVTLANRLGQKKPGASAKAVALASVKQARKKFL